MESVRTLPFNFGAAYCRRQIGNQLIWIRLDAELPVKLPENAGGQSRATAR